MKKMPMLFNAEFPRPHQRIVLNELNPKAVERLKNAHTVVATLKRDGTATFLDDNGQWFARRMVREGGKTPPGFIALEKDPNTGKTFGWEPMKNSPIKKFHDNALRNHDGEIQPGTFELVGTKINGNNDQVEADMLLRHGSEIVEDFPPLENILATDDPMGLLENIFADLKSKHREGVVFWADGEPVVKLRVKDFPNLRH